MYRIRRRFVSFMLTIFLANMLAWSFSTEALADWMFEEQAVSNVAGDTKTNPVDSHQTEKSCNHGCHAASHLQGQVPNALLFFAADTGLPIFLDESFFLPLGIAQRQFRPPRLFSQA